MHLKTERRCVACRQTKPQKEMIRLAKINGDFQFDFLQKLGGRGAYVCNNPDCINLTLKKRLFNRAFKTNVNAEIYAKLEEHTLTQ